MWPLLELVLEKIEIKSEATRSLRDQVLEIRNNPYMAERLLDKLIDDRETSNCSKCDSRYFCSLYLACIYYELGDLEQTKTHIEEAVNDYYHVGSKWNELLAKWIYGTTLLRTGSTLHARRELERTIEMLQEMAKQFRRENQYEKRDECLDFVEKIRDQLNQPVAAQQQRQQPRAQDEERQEPSSRPRQLKYPQWKRSMLIFPVQSQIRAGLKGNFIFENQPDMEATLEEISIDGVFHSFYNLRREGLPITLSPKVYRWLQVDGNSMDQARPFPINNRDYVIAIDANLSNIDVQFGDIVVATLHDPTSDQRAGVIKKCTRRGLESFSSQEYPIIPLKDASIRGIVIAVAKPTNL